MFTIGGWELFIIFVVILVVLGPERLPRFICMVGKIFSQIKEIAHQIEESIFDLSPEDPLGDKNNGPPNHRE